MSEPDENFAVELTDKCDNRSQWLSIVNFGRAELLRKPVLMMELIVRRAEREYREQRAESKPKCVADFAAELFAMLNLEFIG